jgi:ribonuclease G
MSKEIIVNNSKDRARIAIVENEQLSELYVENAENTRTIGDIYVGRVRNLMPSIQAAFIDIGQKQDAFLHFSDVDENFPSLLELIGEKPELGDFPVQLRIRRRAINGTGVSEPVDDSDLLDDEETEIDKEAVKEAKERGKQSGSKSHPALYLRNGERILVQIIKEPIAAKGTRVSSNISIAGRFLVLVPKADYVAVSRKIWSIRERRRLRAIAKSLAPSGFGVIVRTVADGRDAKTLDTDLRLLVDKWKKIEGQIKESNQVPRLLYKDVSMVSSVVRDLFTEDYDRILIDDQRLHRSIKSYVRAVAPQMVNIVRHYRGETPIFEHAGVADAVAQAFSSRVDMQSGGYIFIEHTEAMHVIDVNSGSAGKGKSQEDNAVRVNLEAARLIARQLRLRDLGGIIVVDFIDMRDHSNRRKVFEEVKKEFRNDRAVTKILPISEFGLMQITRQRLRPSITHDDEHAKDVIEAKAERDRKMLQEAQATAAELEKLRANAENGNSSGSRDTRTIDEFINALGRWLNGYKKFMDGRKLILRVHPFTEAFLKKGFPSRIRKIALEKGVHIKVEADEKMAPLVFRCVDPETGEVLSLARARRSKRTRGRG